ncbi:MAG TPA: permease [Ruminiclostridium sp.]|nr:permease [Ruminiclostridium sp.]
MRVQINIVCGFLEAGKTTFIQDLLKKGQGREAQKTVVLCCEEGMEDYRESVLKRCNTVLVHTADIRKLNRALFSEIITDYSPDRIFIEYNGTWEIGEFLKIRLPQGCFLNKIIFLADSSTFSLYMSNMKKIMSEQISNSDIVLLNREGALDSTEINNIEKTLKSINRQVKILYHSSRLPDLTVNNKPYKELKAFMAVVLALFLYIVLVSAKNIDFSEQFKRIQALNTIFISILLQALPFILIGVFISSLLQVFVSDEKFMRIFSRYKWTGFPAAVLLGIIFPVCDCAMAPICSRLVRKGVPVHYVLTFLLSAPVVNPVVITSTYYAFPGNPEIVLLRLGLGITIALSAGLFIKFAGISRDSALNDTILETACAGGYLGDYSERGLPGRLCGFVRHAGFEFFNVAGYIVLGAFITSLLQTLVPRESLMALGNSPFLALLVMLPAAALMSVCSTSNAFIARSFSYSFPSYAVICYMVMGPMLDLKNIMMLSAGFRKRFLAGLVMLLIVIAVFIFSIVAAFV